MDERAALPPTFIPNGGTQLYGGGEGSGPSPNAKREGPDALEALIGQQAGSFRLARVLARGGMGTVFLGEHAAIGSRVAVKVLHPHLARDRGVVQRFYAEARAVNLIGHPNIVKIYDMSRLATGEWYLVMEYLEGESAAALLHTPQPPERVAAILLEVLAALQAAHRRGIIHRDVKPENVFLVAGPDGTRSVKLLDFGIARFFGETSGNGTQTGVVLGTPAFMSPEQWQGGRVDARSDVYAVGALGRALLGHAPPFLARDPSVPPSPLDGPLERALATRPEDRHATARSMAEAITRAMEAGTRAPPLPPPPKPVRYDGVVSALGRQDRVRFSDLSRAGVFVLAEDDFPPLRTLVDVSLALPGGRLEVRAEVVRHVPPEVARTWKMEPGYALQFLEGGRALSGRVKQLLSPKPVSEPGAPRRSQPAPAEVRPPPPVAGPEQRLQALSQRSSADLYAFIEAAPDASMSEVRRKVRALGEELSQLEAASLPPGDLARLRRLRERLEDATSTLCVPERRAAHDAERGNYLGVARCIAGGLAVSELEAMRSAYERRHPKQVTRAQVHQLTAELQATRGELEVAVREYELALPLDPLNLGMQQAYWALRRRRSERAAR